MLVNKGTWSKALAGMGLRCAAAAGQGRGQGREPGRKSKFRGRRPARRGLRGANRPPEGLDESRLSGGGYASGG